jgi:ADP-ribose pyrophosphatase YjhB (NUDIX family)
MPVLGVNTAIIEGGKVLLTLREDFEVWCLPGGSVDAGESVAEAAVRETLEETGLQVTLTGMVGIYSRPAWLNGGIHVVLFSARVTGGVLKPQPAEVLEARFFGLDELPNAMLFGHEQRIRDAASGRRGLAWRQEAEWPHPAGMTRAELYQACTDSGLDKAEFYRQQVGRPLLGGERLEAGE